jgi:IMP dehydrogenase/GMP reductase
MKYSLNDISVVPARVSLINHRSECNPYTDNKMLPLFTAPMSTVVDLNNYKKFKDNGIAPIIPRTVSFSERFKLSSNTWCAFSLDEFIKMSNETNDGKTHYLLIDIANGHMKRMHDAIEEAKDEHGDTFIIMAGNIANPETYRVLSDAGADYVRVGIGTGNACKTANMTSIYFPLASLIKECFEESLYLEDPAKIIADGGIKGYSDIIKCLGLGSDFVMVGSEFNKMFESAGNTFDENGNSIDQYTHKFEKDKYYKEYYGMSTKKAQEEINGLSNKESEGIEKVQKAEYTMSQWVERFKNYLRSAMSYTSCASLDDFIGNVETIVVSDNSYRTIEK